MCEVVTLRDVVVLGTRRALSRRRCSTMFSISNGHRAAPVRLIHGTWRRGHTSVARVWKECLGWTGAAVLENSTEHEHQSDNQSSSF